MYGTTIGRSGLLGSYNLRCNGEVAVLLVVVGGIDNFPAVGSEGGNKGGGGASSFIRGCGSTSIPAACFAACGSLQDAVDCCSRRQLVHSSCRVAAPPPFQPSHILPAPVFLFNCCGSLLSTLLCRLRLSQEEFFLLLWRPPLKFSRLSRLLCRLLLSQEEF